MTIRAFLLGLIGVIGLCLLAPYNDYVVGNTYLTGNHFPVGVFFFIVVLTLGLNVLIKLVRRQWALRQPELMLVWCMMTVAATVPGSGLMRYGLPVGVAPAYMAPRADLVWEDDILKLAPKGILVTTDMRSATARRFYEGTPRGEVVRVPWREWTPFLTTWGIYVALYYLATLFLCSVLRKHWVESERLSFPLARVPLELTEGSAEPALLPPLLRNKAFLIGACVTLALGLVRLVPLAFGKSEGWHWRMPLMPIFQDTPLSASQVADAVIFPLAIGFAFLVPRDVSFSIWGFYVFTCIEIQTAQYMGRPLENGPWGPFFGWQQVGSFWMLALLLLWAARRQLLAVARRAVGLGKRSDDATEPISYPVAFWGLLLSILGMAAWNVHFGMSPFVAMLVVLMTLSIVLVTARLATQGGLFFMQHGWMPPDMIHAISGGTAFTPTGALVAKVQSGILLTDGREIFGPHAMNATRAADVLERGRRWFLPVMIVALAVALVAACYSSLQFVYYNIGGVASKQDYHVNTMPVWFYNTIHSMLSDPTGSAKTHLGALSLGASLTLVLTVLRGTLYWWPIHPIGLAVAGAWPIREVWFSFFLGWLAKVSILRFGSGGTLRKARLLFMGVIVGESVMIGLSTFFSLFTGIRTGYIFMSP